MSNYRRDDSLSPLTLAVVVVVALGALVFLAWFFHFLGWGLREDSVNREGHVNRQSYGYQQARHEELGNDISTINGINVQLAAAHDPTQQQALGAQRWAVVNQACSTAAQITELDGEQETWVADNCQAGAGKPGSQYAPTAS